MTVTAAPLARNAAAAARPTRLLHVFSTFKVGGPQVRFAQLANGLGRAYSHAVLATDGRYEAEALLNPTVDYTRVSIEHDKARHLRNLNLYRRTIAAAMADRLVTYNWGAVEWALANLFVRRPHVHIEDGFGPEERDRQLPRRILFRRLVLGRSQVAVPSRTLERIARSTWRLPGQRVHYIPNGIDPTRFDRKPDPNLLDSLGINNDSGLIVGTIAVLREEKNLSRLLSAVARVCADWPARLLIVGDGPERAKLADQARTLGIADRVVLAGHVSEPERILPAFDIFALSSDTEQMPYSVLEAMAARLPIATVDVGDVVDMLAEANRPLACARDEAALSAVLLKLLRDADLRRRLGAENRRRVEERFSQVAMFAAYDALFGGAAGLSSEAGNS